MDLPWPNTAGNIELFTEDCRDIVIRIEDGVKILDLLLFFCDIVTVGVSGLKFSLSLSCEIGVV